MKCPKCGTGHLIAIAGQPPWPEVSIQCSECDYSTVSLTELFEIFRESIIKEVKRNESQTNRDRSEALCWRSNGL
jgi:hypothetical protein